MQELREHINFKELLAEQTPPESPRPTFDSSYCIRIALQRDGITDEAVSIMQASIGDGLMVSRILIRTSIYGND
uniref:Uncharacterized protein n=1 Tax=Trichogramma kaykai TaxID=54128 RepID=A0ABD2WU59_9HYME